MTSSVISQSPGHLLLLCAPIWGHLRPLSAFAGKVAQKSSDILITFLVVGGYDKRVQGEVNRYMPRDEADFHARVRVVQIGGDKSFELFQLLGDMVRAFPDYYQKLVLSEGIQCQSTGRAFSAVRAPTLALIDFFLLPILESIRARTGKAIPVLAWGVTNIFFTLRIFGPEELGGLGDVPAKARLLAQKTGRDENELADELTHPTSGELVHIPGLPPTYDYEWHPQGRDYSIDNTTLHNMGYVFMRKCDGFVSISSSAYEPDAMDALRKWLANTGNRKLYVVGPLVPVGVGNANVEVSVNATSFELAMSENGHEFQQLLDKTLKTHGKQSLIYMSFGSLWWPKNENVLLFVDVLLELGIPFIFSATSPKANIPTEVAQKVKASGIGIISKWSPQQTILNHPVTGWVLTHCGQNTVMEALSEGLPMIAWPIDVDQPGNAMHLAYNLDLAFDLLEVRSSEIGLKPLYRGVQAKGIPEALVAEAKEVLAKTRGEEGTRKRKNAEAMRDRLRMAWEDGGEGLEGASQLLRLASKKNWVAS